MFDHVPFAHRPPRTGVTVPLFEVNWLVGAAMGNGKTGAVRESCWPGRRHSTPSCDLWTHEFSGKGDLEPFAQVSHRYCSGLDDESIAYAAESAAMLRDELVRRQKISRKCRGKPAGRES